MTRIRFGFVVVGVTPAAALLSGTPVAGSQPAGLEDGEAGTLVDGADRLATAEQAQVAFRASFGVPAGAEALERSAAYPTAILFAGTPLTRQEVDQLESRYRQHAEIQTVLADLEELDGFAGFWHEPATGRFFLGSPVIPRRRVFRWRRSLIRR